MLSLRLSERFIFVSVHVTRPVTVRAVTATHNARTCTLCFLSPVHKINRTSPSSSGTKSSLNEILITAKGGQRAKRGGTGPIGVARQVAGEGGNRLGDYRIQVMSLVASYPMIAFGLLFTYFQAPFPPSRILTP